MTYAASGRGVFQYLTADRAPARDSEWADRRHAYAWDRGDPEDRCACGRMTDSLIHTSEPREA